MKDSAVLINGEAAATISVRDRGLQFGDGLFETVAWVDGHMPFWAQHMQRLADGCRRLGIAPPDAVQLQDEAHRVAAGQPRAVIKIILTRGASQRGYAFDTDSTPTRIVSRHPWPQLPAADWQNGIVLTWCRTTLAQQPLLAGIKHLNRLEQVLARAELRHTAAQEGLLCDTAGHVIEATAHNVFLVMDDEFVTPSLTRAGVAGIMRQYVCDRLIGHGHKVHIRDVSRDEVQKASGLFLCNSVHGIWPVRQCDESLYTVSPVVRELIEHINTLLPYP